MNVKKIFVFVQVRLQKKKIISFFRFSIFLEHGAHIVQLDFTEARLSLKIDPSGKLLKEFVAINNDVLNRFSIDDQKKIGVHVCPGGDCDCYVSFIAIYSKGKKAVPGSSDPVVPGGAQELPGTTGSEEPGTAFSPLIYSVYI